MVTDPITGNAPVREIPQATGGAVVVARFKMSPELAAIGQSRILRALNAVRSRIKSAIRDSAVREYKASGLRIITGTLIREVITQFVINASIRGRDIFIEAVWTPRIPYFFIHLLGGIITQRRVARTIRIVIPRRNFIRFDNTARNKIESILDQVMRQELKRALEARPSLVAEFERRIIAGRRAVRISRISGREARLAAQLARRVRAEGLERRIVTPSGRLTARTLRRGLRREGISAPAARAAAAELFLGGFTAFQIAELLTSRRRLVRSVGALQVLLRL